MLASERTMQTKVVLDILITDSITTYFFVLYEAMNSRPLLATKLIEAYSGFLRVSSFGSYSTILNALSVHSLASGSAALK